MVLSIQAKTLRDADRSLEMLMVYTVCSIRLNMDTHGPGFILHVGRESKAKAFEPEILISQGSTVVIDLCES